jgi:hypothetical protein
MHPTGLCHNVTKAIHAPAAPMIQPSKKSSKESESKERQPERNLYKGNAESGLNSQSRADIIPRYRLTRIIGAEHPKGHPIAASLASFADTKHGWLWDHYFNYEVNRKERAN